VKLQIEPLPTNKKSALQWLMALDRAADCKTLRRVPERDFKRGWEIHCSTDRFALFPKWSAGRSGTWHEFEADKLANEEFYCSESMITSMCPRDLGVRRRCAATANRMQLHNGN
jgi:hypothetical protein